MGPFDVINDLASLLAIGEGLWMLRKRVGWTDVYWGLQDTLADLRLKTKGHIVPVLIERLDDGCDPGHQYLRLTMAPSFPPERIANALHYWQGQSLENVITVLWAEAYLLAVRGAQPGEERVSTVTIDVLDGVGSYTATVRGRVGGEWHLSGEQKAISVRGILAFARDRTRQHSQLREEAKARRKAKRSTTSGSHEEMP